MRIRFAAALVALIMLVSCSGPGRRNTGTVATERGDITAPVAEPITEDNADVTGTAGTSFSGSPEISETGTADAPPDTAQKPPVTTPKAAETDSPDPVFREISPLAAADYMTPVEDYSFNRDRGIEFIMVHFSSNVKAKPDNPYVLEDIKNIYLSGEVSTNYVIDREGNIFCFIPEYRCAWHAGVGSWKGDKRLTNKMNLYSIGIELLAMGSENEMLRYISAEQYRALPESFIGYTEAQYEALARLLNDLCACYGVPRDRDHIIGHQEYATKKPDPGELFDWYRIM